MRLPPSVAAHLEAVLRELLNFSGPADGVLSRYFREHPKLGARERGAIAEAAYGVLRNKAMYTNFSESGAGSAMRRLALIGLTDAFGAEAIGGLSEQETQWLEQIGRIDRQTLPVSLRANLPAWLLERLIAQFGKEEALAFADAVNRPAPLDLRANALKATRDEVMAALTAIPVTAELMRWAPNGVRVLGKPVLQNLPLFQAGGFEVQDEGSQLLSQLVGARRGEMVVDFCAGAGGKTLALGAAMRSTGRLYAFDVSEKRLAKLKPRLARSGLSNVHPALIAHENDAKVKRLSGKIDRVLVDAPCTGLGTLRRNPDMKWRQTEATVAEMTAKQGAILEGASRLVKPGGRLVYGTCSVLNEENDAVVERFLAAHPDFALVPADDVLAEQKIDLQTGRYLQLLPHRHQTDGFFAAVLERR
ncbi:MAG: RsmB/NOP family class I SAM-dependent RNA methyltransferase [Burkholderiaceae bacterium]